MGIIIGMKHRIDNWFRKYRNKKEEKYLLSLRKRNRKDHCSIICNNCVGGVIYHNLGLRFDSPTVNLFITGREYLEFCKNLLYYSTCDLIQSEETMKNGYPVGVLIPKDELHIPVRVFFQHYKSFEDAKKKWIERFNRVDFDNLYFIWEFYDTIYDNSLMYEFDHLPLNHKIIITHKSFPGIKNSFFIHCYTNDKPIAKILEYNGLTGKRYLDEFDYVGFINEE